MKPVAEKVRESIQRRKQGVPFATESLFHLGSRGAVRQALWRLCEEGVLERTTRGVYVRPRISAYVGKVIPEPFLVAKAKSAGEPVMVNGAEAARLLGLSTQMSVRNVFITTGKSKKFEIQGRSVELKHVSRKKVKAGSGNVTLASAAMSYLGKELVTEEIALQIKKALTQTEFKELLAFSRSMPEWAQKSLEGVAFA